MFIFSRKILDCYLLVILMGIIFPLLYVHGHSEQLSKFDLKGIILDLCFNTNWEMKVTYQLIIEEYY